MIKVVGANGATGFRLIDLELAGRAGDVCLEAPYPLPHWDGGSVLEADGRYTPRSDLRMVGKELMGKLLVDLTDTGRDLQRKLERGEYESASMALQHGWFTA